MSQHPFNGILDARDVKLGKSSWQFRQLVIDRHACYHNFTSSSSRRLVLLQLQLAHRSIALSYHRTCCG